MNDMILDEERESVLKADLKEVPIWIIAARIEAARMRKYSSTAAALVDLEKQWGMKRRTYYSHESSARKARLPELQRYSQTFDVPLDYFIYGDEKIVPEQDIQAYSKPKRSWHMTATEGRGVPEDEEPFNLTNKEVSFNASQKWSTRFIVVLRAGEINRLDSQRGELTNRSGETVPLPAFVTASLDTFAYRIPAHDFSMVIPHGQGLSLIPGSVVIADIQRPIMPGDLVIASITKHKHPAIRRYNVENDPEQGALFKLDSLNPDIPPIRIFDESECPTLARIIFVGSLV